MSLKALQAEEVKTAEEVSTSLVDLPGVRLKIGWKRAMAALVAAVVVAVLVIQPPLHEISILSAGLGGALTIVVFLFGEILAVPRARNSKSWQG